MGVAGKYPLTGAVHARLNRLLALRRAGEPDSAAMQSEAAALQRVLIG
jgi:hypothetical protein